MNTKINTSLLKQLRHDAYSTLDLNYEVAFSSTRDNVQAMFNHIDALEAEINQLHARLAGEVLRADQGWERYEAANKSHMAALNSIAKLKANQVVVGEITDVAGTFGTVLIYPEGCYPLGNVRVGTKLCVQREMKVSVTTPDGKVIQGIMDTTHLLIPRAIDEIDLSSINLETIKDNHEN